MERKGEITVKNNRILSLILTLIFIPSIFNMSVYAGANLPTLKDDGIDGSMMTPDSPAFGSYEIGSIWDEEVLTDLPTLKDDGIDGSMMTPDSPAFGSYEIGSIWDEIGNEVTLSNLVFRGNVRVPENITGEEGVRVATFKLEPGDDIVDVKFLSSQDEDRMDQINAALINYSSGTVEDWYPGLRLGKSAKLRVENPSDTDYYAVYVSTNKKSTIARLEITTR